MKTKKEEPQEPSAETPLPTSNLLDLKEESKTGNVTIVIDLRSKYPSVSLLQLRLSDYVAAKRTQRKYFKERPKPNFGSQQPQESKTDDKKMITQQIDVPLTYDNIFDSIQTAQAEIKSAKEFFTPVAIAKFATESLTQTDRIGSNEKEISSKYEKYFLSQKKLPTSTTVSKNYDHLFECSIANSSQYNSICKTPIVITENQLKCGIPQNFKTKINIINIGNKTRLIRESYGTIDFLNFSFSHLDPYDITTFVEIEERYVYVNFKKALEYGIDLEEANVEAIITLENVKPSSLFDQNNGSYENSLKNFFSEKENLVFIHYFPKEGKLIFYVKSFLSKNQKGELVNEPFKLPMN